MFKLGSIDTGWYALDAEKKRPGENRGAKQQTERQLKTPYSYGVLETP